MDPMQNLRMENPKNKEKCLYINRNQDYKEYRRTCHAGLARQQWRKGTMLTEYKMTYRYTRELAGGKVG